MLSKAEKAVGPKDHCHTHGTSVNVTNNVLSKSWNKCKCHWQRAVDRMGYVQKSMAKHYLTPWNISWAMVRQIVLGQPVWCALFGLL